MRSLAMLATTNSRYLYGARTHAHANANANDVFLSPSGKNFIALHHTRSVEYLLRHRKSSLLAPRFFCTEYEVALITLKLLERPLITTDVNETRINKSTLAVSTLN